MARSIGSISLKPLLVILMIIAVGSALADGLDPVQFIKPAPGHKPAILWFWHDTKITDEVISAQLEQMRSEGFADVMIFPLASDPKWYTDEWFDVMDKVLREAHRTDMKIWLFIDNHVPSGRAAGLLVSGGTLNGKEYKPHPEFMPQQVTRTALAAEGKKEIDVRRIWPGMGSPTLKLQAVNGRLSNRAADVSIVNKGADWTDYTYSLDIEPNPTDTHAADTPIYLQAGWVFRAIDEKNGYVWMISTYPYEGKGSYLLRCALVNGSLAILKTIRLPFDMETGKAYRVETIVSGNSIQTRINGELVDTATDTMYAKGSVGFRQTGLETAWFDNVKVTAADGATLLDLDFDSPDDLNVFAKPVSPDSVIAVSALPIKEGKPTLEGMVDLTDKFKAGDKWSAPDSDYRIEYYSREYVTDIGGQGYTDLLNPEIVEAFAEIIYGQIQERFGWALGKTLAGLWDDEPVTSAGVGYYPWSDAFPARIKSFGQSVAGVLPAAFDDLGREGRIARQAYCRAYFDGWADAWSRVNGKWAEKLGVPVVSNPLADDSGPSGFFWGGGDPLKNNQWYQIPGVDVIFKQIIQGGRTILPRWATSAAHQGGQTGTLFEMFGGYGWYVAPADIRYVTGACLVRGANIPLFHAFWSNKNNVGYAPPFDPGSTWWKHLDTINDWAARLVYINKGKSGADTAMIVPTHSIEGSFYRQEQLDLDHDFLLTSYALEDVQADFDYLSEASLDGDPTMKLQGKAEEGMMKVGKTAYRVLVLVPATTMSLETARRLEEFVKSGGIVLAHTKLPTLETDGKDDELKETIGGLFNSGRRSLGDGWTAFARDMAEFKRYMIEAKVPAARLVPANDKVRVSLQKHDNDLAYLIMNESEEIAKLEAVFPINGEPEIWNPENATIKSARKFRNRDGETAVPLELHPHQVMVVVFRENPVEDKTSPEMEQVKAIQLGGDWSFNFDKPDSRQQTVKPGSWTDYDPTFVGSGLYEKTFNLDSGDFVEGRRWVLDLGNVRETAEIKINDADAETIIWPPYRMDVTDIIKTGENTISVKVTNTLGNSHGEMQPSGLMGPVRIIILQEKSDQKNK